MTRPSPAKAKQTTLLKGKSITCASLPQYDLILPSRPNALRLFIENKLAGVGLRANVTLEVEGMSSVLDLAANGHGHTILPTRRITGTTGQRALTYHEITKPRLTMGLALVLSSRRPVTPLTERVIALISNLGIGQPECRRSGFFAFNFASAVRAVARVESCLARWLAGFQE